MAGRGANVGSLEAIEAFRAALVVYVTKASRVLDQVGDEVRRTRMWVQQDQRAHWQSELRRRTRRLDQARQELFSARLSNLKEQTARQEAQVRRAQEAVHEAEGKLRKLKEWTRNFDSRVGSLARKVDGLEDLIKRDLPKAIAHLAELEKRIEAYAAAEAPRATGGFGSARAGEEGSATPEDGASGEEDASGTGRQDAGSTDGATPSPADPETGADSEAATEPPIER